MDRRKFLVLAGMGAALPASLPGVARTGELAQANNSAAKEPPRSAAVTSGFEWRRKRRELAHRCRRLLFNDDGDEIYSDDLNGTPAKTVPEFLSRRFDRVKDTQVDSYCWNTYVPGAYGATVPFGDPGSVIFDAAHAAGMETVATMRMNDIHEAFAEKLSTPFKIQHRDLLMEPDGSSNKYPPSDLRYWFWCSLDFASSEVREYKLGIISRICETYSPDVFEMDFMRGPMYFRRGEEAANLPVMTEFVRNVRRCVDRVGHKRGRPMLLSARVTDTPGTSLRLGLDVESWLREGLLDMLAIGLGYAPCGGAWKEFATLARQHEVPAHPVLDSCLLEQLKQVEPQRGVAMNFWQEGASSIYLFNNPFVPVHERILSPEVAYGELKIIGSPETLHGLDKTYMQDDADPNTGARGVWCVDAEAEMPLPALITIPYSTIPLFVGEDLASIPSGKRRALTLRLGFDSAVVNQHLIVRLNGQVLAPGRPADERWIEFDVQAPPVSRGPNEVSIALTHGEVLLRALQLSVRYV